MANRLKMANLEAILSLYQRKWSIRRIAKELGLHRDTVARYVQLHEAKAKPASAAEGAQSSKQATPAAGASAANRPPPRGAHRLGDSAGPEVAASQPVRTVAANHPRQARCRTDCAAHLPGPGTW
jgi:hypothetical protein